MHHACIAFIVNCDHYVCVVELLNQLELQYTLSFSLVCSNETALEIKSISR